MTITGQSVHKACTKRKSSLGNSADLLELGVLDNLHFPRRLTYPIRISLSPQLTYNLTIALLTSNAVGRVVSNGKGKGHMLSRTTKVSRLVYIICYKVRHGNTRHSLESSWRGVSIRQR